MQLAICEFLGHPRLERGTPALNISVNCMSPYRSDYPIPLTLILKRKSDGVSIIVVEPPLGIKDVKGLAADCLHLRIFTQ